MPCISRRALLLVAVASLLAWLPAPERLAAQSGPSLVVLVRHAEKAAVPGDDPPLSELGQERAAALAAALHSAPPSAIITSTRRRTFDTAADVVQHSGAPVHKISLDGGGAAHIAAVAAAVMQQTGTVLVVGHSNTIPAIIKALGGPTLPDICDATYSHFFTLVPKGGNAGAMLTIARFGANEAASPARCAGMMAK